MGDLGIRVVRVYTLLPPGFYEELAAYNEPHPSDADLPRSRAPTCPTSPTSRRAAPSTTRRSTRRSAQELHDISDAVHGDLTAPETSRPGRRHATTRDVSPWLAGWIIGVEWDPAGRRADRRGARGRAVPPGGVLRRRRRRDADRALDRHATWTRSPAARPTAAAPPRSRWPTGPPPTRSHHPEEPPRERGPGLDRRDARAADRRLAGRDLRELPRSTPTTRTSSATSPASQDEPWNGRGDPYAGYVAAMRDHYAADDAAAGHRVRRPVLARHRPRRAAGPRPGRPHRAGGDGRWSPT